jgi:hypothetical protein
LPAPTSQRQVAMPAHPYLEPPYTFNKLRKAKKKEVIDELNRQFDLFKTDTTGDKPLHALYAQFLMQELARRDQNWQTGSIIFLTLVITAMTAAQLWIALHTSCAH